MKVILLRDVARLGKRYSIIEVPDGFALNKLLPQGLAQAATPENVKRVNAREKEVAAHAAADEVSLRAALKQLNDNPLIILAEANEQGHLFKAIKSADVSDAAKIKGIAIEAAVIQIANPIKSTGLHEIAVKKGGVNGAFTITVNKK